MNKSKKFTICSREEYQQISESPTPDENTNNGTRLEWINMTDKLKSLSKVIILAECFQVINS